MPFEGLMTGETPANAIPDADEHEDADDAEGDDEHDEDDVDGHGNSNDRAEDEAGGRRRPEPSDLISVVIVTEAAAGTTTSALLEPDIAVADEEDDGMVRISESMNFSSTTSSRSESKWLKEAARSSGAEASTAADLAASSMRPWPRGSAGPPSRSRTSSSSSALKCNQ
jgi:hypothetical protein